MLILGIYQARMLSFNRLPRWFKVKLMLIDFLVAIIKNNSGLG